MELHTLLTILIALAVGINFIQGWNIRKRHFEILKRITELAQVQSQTTERSMETKPIPGGMGHFQEYNSLNIKVAPSPIGWWGVIYSNDMKTCIRAIPPVPTKEQAITAAERFIDDHPEFIT